ncbi:MAG: TIGR02452 family protein [Ruminococcus sp.]|nr:TIGR02452 family protein [Ruminococcus sp.]
MINFLKIKLENDKIFKSGCYPDMQSKVYSPEQCKHDKNFISKKNFNMQDCFVKTDTISAILQEFKLKADSKIIALNFANAMFPGGGYMLGGNAQEEALCRASLLYYSIRTAKAYYQANRLHILPNYTDYMIYSENVPLIRDNTGNLLNNLITCNFITCPAVNRNFAKFLFSNQKLDFIMQNRINNIIKLAAMQNADILILGAFGCGMFGNKRKSIYPMFEQAILNFVPEHVKIIFADPQAGKYLNH